MAGYWLKLYTEILDDPKYFRLSDNAKLGMIELMVVAKRVDMEGEVPCIEDVAFYTRRAVEWWQPVFDELSKIEYLVINGSETIIRKFAERQAPVPDSERMRQLRINKHRNEFALQTSDEAVTKRNGDSDTEKIQIKDTEKSIHAIQLMIEHEIGLPPSGVNDIKAMDEMELMNPTKEDIHEAAEWLRGQGKTIRYYSSLTSCVRTAIAKRVQPKKQTVQSKNDEILQKFMENANGG
jgi:hypothetical protein